MKLLTEYISLKDQIFDRFGYAEDWKVHPLDDMRNVYWSINQDNDRVQWFKDKEKIGKYEGLYGAEIGRDRFLPKYIYEGSNEAEGFTMILCDTQTDGNVLLMIFDNTKKIDWQEDIAMEGYGD